MSLKAVPNIKGDDSWMLPLPATYIIAPDRRIALAEIELDYRKHLEPETIIAALRSLQAKAAIAA
jgi:peroxiredoxin